MQKKKFRPTMLLLAIWFICMQTFSVPAITLAANSLFEQGVGYEQGAYDLDAEQPTTFNWTRQSSFTGSVDHDEKWSFAAEDVIYSSPAIGADGVLYIGSYDGNLYAIDSKTGALQWSFVTGFAIASSPVIGADGTIYIGSGDGKLYALDPNAENDEEREKWSFETDDRIYSSPAIGADGTIYISSYDGYIYALNPDADNESEREKWSYEIGGETDSSPAIGADGTIYVGSGEGFFYALDPAAESNEEREKWSIELNMEWDGLCWDEECPIYSSPAIGVDGTIYVGSSDGYLYALDPNALDNEERIKWSFDTWGSVYSSPAIGADGTVYVGSISGTLYALDPNADDENREKWSFETATNIWTTIISSPLIGADDTIYIGSSNGKLYALDPNADDENREKWSFSTEGEVHSSPVIGVDGTLYIGSYDGNLYALGTKIPQVSYDPNGVDAWAKQHTTIVTGSNTDGINLQYQWLINDDSLSDDNWKDFLSEDEIMISDGTGEYYLHVRGLDADNQVVLSDMSEAFKLDNTSPTEPTIHAPTEWMNDDLSLSIHAGTDEESGVEKTEYRIGKNDEWTNWIELDGDENLLIEDEGETTIQAKTIDKAGNESEIISEIVRIDRTAPTEPTIGLNPDGWTNVEEVAVRIKTGEDEASGVARVEYRIGIEGEWQVYDDSFSIIEEGETNIYARTVDQAGNISEEAEATAQIKRTSPSNPVIEVETNDWTNATSMEVKITSDGDKIEYQLNGTDGDWLTYVPGLEITDEGETTIYAQAVDQAGNKSDIVEAIIRIDHTAPELTLLGDNPIYIKHRETFVEPGYKVVDNLDEAIADKMKVRGTVDTETVGVYALTYAVTDHAGNETTETREIHVVDEEQPIIILQGNNPLILEVGTAYEEPGAIAKDNADGDISDQIEITTNVDTTKLGIYQVIYKVIDSSNNYTEVIRAVEVVDTTIPEIALEGESEIIIELGDSYKDPGAIAIDNYDGELTNQIEIHGNVNTEQIGTYELVYTVEDSSGNIAKTVRIVKIVDSTAPNKLELVATEVTATSITLEFSASDLGGIKSYILSRNGEEIVMIDGNTTTFTDKVLQPNETYNYSLIAVDYSNNRSEGKLLTVTTQNEEKIEVERVEELPDLTVAFGTERAELSFPEQVTIVLTNGESMQVPVHWSNATYDPNLVGVYTFIGGITLPDEVINPENKQATIKVVVNPPDIVEIILDKPAELVYPGALVKVKYTNTTLQLPENLPEGTTLQVKSVKDIATLGLVQVGEMYDFIFSYPKGQEDYTGEVVLTMGVEDTEEQAALYHYNETTNTWEYIGGERKEGQIATSVSQFSIYGVLAKEIDEEPPPVLSEIVIHGAEKIMIPASDESKIIEQYKADIFNENGELISDEKVQWSITAAKGISIDETDGSLTVTNQASAGEVIVRATSVSDETIFAEIIITLVDMEEKPTINAQVIVRHVDEYGNELAKSEKLIGEIGERYESKPADIDGYELIDTPANAIGEFMKEIQTVEYVYAKINEKPSTTPPTESNDSDRENDNKANDDKESDTDTHEKLPSTATNTFNWLIIGITLLVIGVMTFFIYQHRSKLD